MVIKDGRAYVQAGGGVVADSDPSNEYQESLNKAKALLRALDEAEKIAREGRERVEPSPVREEGNQDATLN
jgi:anthranilate synthase component 1